ncbi:hypothetical protein E5163_02865 [Marinicauda algicola]|uniref:Tetratricopeptide repeat protein n=1 Tax=Marinicauda algicola TaxID=2029849 RepID=A0A4S2H3E1_9PROT|nr:hypothetical protein [Marinicauda algicola]TGY90086.1 hypothetical protein E5163_02865 [Marinicauda algicola]
MSAEGFVSELIRRNVVRVAGVYGVVGWLLAQLSAFFENAFSLPSWFDGLIAGLLILAFPIALLLAWAADLSPQGLRRAPLAEPLWTRRALWPEFTILAALAVLIGVTAAPRTASPPSGEAIALSDPRGPTEKSIAVLPFSDFSEADDGWFADGLTEEILNSLARTPDLLVASRTSSFAYKDSAENLPAIASSLGVAHVLEGSVRRAGDRLRITAQLIRASDGFHLWSETYDRPVADVIDIQEDIAIEIASALETAMNPEALGAMVSSGTRSVAAYEAFLEGQALYARAMVTLSDEDWSRAREAFVRSARLDPQFAAAHFEAGLSWANTVNPAASSGDDRVDALTALDEASRYFEAAITLSDDPVRTLRYRAERASLLGALREAAGELEAYLERIPNDIQARFDLVELYQYLGAPAEAQVHLEQMEARAQPTGEHLNLLIQGYQWSSETPRAAELARRALTDGSRNAGLLYQAHRSLLWAGDIEGAGQVFERYIRLPDVQDDWTRFIPEMRQACAEGDRARAERAAAELAAIGETSGLWHAYSLLRRDDEIFALLQDLDRTAPPFPLIGFLIYPHFDPEPYPGLQALIERERIDPPRGEPIPFACPPAEIAQ